MQEPLAKELKDIFDVRNTLVGCDTIEDAVTIALQITHRKLNSQTVSVFLFSKNGFLERVAITGVDKNGATIANDWFADEKHDIGESFTGKVLLPREKTDFGEPHLSNNLEGEELSALSKTRYLEKLGSLNCALAVPLNGQHRTYGVLEIINKLGDDGCLNPEGFSQDDVYWLSIIGINLATAISGLKRDSKLKTLAELSQMLVEPFGGKFDPTKIYEDIAKKLVGPPVNYKACIIRIEDSSGDLQTVARDGDGILWENRIDKPLRRGERIAGSVYNTNGIKNVEEIEKHKEEFKNLPWINANHLKSYICLPLSTKEKPVGTLSLFTGFHYKFYSSDIHFLQNITHLVAAFVESSRVVNELRLSRLELDNATRGMQNAAKGIIFDLSIQSLLHEEKHTLQKIQQNLETAVDSNPKYGAVLIAKQIEFIKNEITKLSSDLNSESAQRLIESVDINRVIKDVTKYFNLEFKALSQDIYIKLQLSSDVPIISAVEAEIKEVVFNLLSNSEKAIREANRKKGEITVATEIIIDRGISYIQITVEDNGIGIRNEDKIDIFGRGFRKFKEGSGAGLFITSNIVKNIYGGKIFIDSSVGKGAKFYVQLPMKRLLDKRG